MARMALIALPALAVTACNQASMPNSEAATEEAQPAAAASAAPAPMTEAFVGRRAMDPAQCTLEQDDPDSPIIVTAKGYDQYDSHCDFTSVTPTATNAWTIAATCVAEGHPSTDNFLVTVDGDRMTMAGSVATLTRLRCP